MHHRPRPDAGDLQPRLADRLLTALSRYRRGGRRARVARRVVAALLLVAAGVVAIGEPTPADTGSVVQLAARDLPVGATLRPDDLRTTRVRSPPDGALPAAPSPVGRVLSGPVRRGEVLTDVRMLGIDGPQPGPGRAAVPVRPDDPGTVGLLTPGMRVAVIGVGPGGTAHTLTDDAVVLWIPRPDDAAARTSGGRLVVLAVPRSAADTIAATAMTGTIGIRFA